jgi:hypothetical protein
MQRRTVTHLNAAEHRAAQRVAQRQQELLLARHEPARMRKAARLPDGASESRASALAGKQPSRLQHLQGAKLASQDADEHWDARNQEQESNVQSATLQAHLFD